MSHERPHGWSLYTKATGLSAFQFRITGKQKGHHERVESAGRQTMIGRGARGPEILLQGGVPARKSVLRADTGN
jgi:hypothetical protein